MALKSWLASLKADVSGVSGVQPNAGAGFGRYVTETAEVSDVSGSNDMRAIDTADTGSQTQTYQCKPNTGAGCTADTGETCKKIDAKAEAANGPLMEAISLPPTTAPATEQADWKALDKAYQAHHVNCPTCITAGKGYGRRCGTGVALWAAYSDVQPPGYGRAQAREVSGRVGTSASNARTPTAKNPPHPSLMTAATEAEIQVMQSRLALFAYLGVQVDVADRLADKLMQRDREGDDRRLCFECQHLIGFGGSYRCSQWRQAHIAPVGLAGELAMTLQRCPMFTKIDDSFNSALFDSELSYLFREACC